MSFLYAHMDHPSIICSGVALYYNFETSVLSVCLFRPFCCSLHWRCLLIQFSDVGLFCVFILTIHRFFAAVLLTITMLRRRNHRGNVLQTSTSNSLQRNTFHQGILNCTREACPCSLLPLLTETVRMYFELI